MNKKEKTLKELTLKDNFMFGAVMTEEENCRRFLEAVLEISISRVRIIKEKSMGYHPEYKGVRLDIYVEDEKKTRYNVEMQVEKPAALEKRSRYYHSQMDMEMLAAGKAYTELADSIVIFICDFDPFGRKKYRYIFHNYCKESGYIRLKDGRTTIFLSTCGEDEQNIPRSLFKFLKYVGSDLHESQKDFEDDLVKQLQYAVARIKENRDMEEKYMVLEEMLREERMEGKMEGIALGITGFLEELDTIPEELRQKLTRERDLKALQKYLKLAAQVKSVEEFRRETGL